MVPHPGTGAMTSEGAPLTLDLDPPALGAHYLLIWSPCMLLGAPFAPYLGPHPAAGVPSPMVSTVVPLAVYLGAPLALDAPKALDLERMFAPCSTGSSSGAPGSFKGIMVSKGVPLALRGPASSSY